MPFLSRRSWLRGPSQAKRSKAEGTWLGRASPAPGLLPKVPRQLEGTGQVGTMQQRARAEQHRAVPVLPLSLRSFRWATGRGGAGEGRGGQRETISRAGCYTGLGTAVQPHVCMYMDLHMCAQTCTHTDTRGCAHVPANTHTCVHGPSHMCTHRYAHRPVHAHTQHTHTCSWTYTHTQTCAHGLCTAVCAHTTPACARPHTHKCACMHGGPVHTRMYTQSLCPHVCVHTEPVHPRPL